MNEPWPRDPRSEPTNPLWSGDVQPTNAKLSWEMLRKALEAVHNAPRDPVVQPAPVEDVELIGGPSDGERVTVALHVVSIRMDGSGADVETLAAGDNFDVVRLTPIVHVYERAGPHQDFRYFGVGE